MASPDPDEKLEEWKAQKNRQTSNVSSSHRAHNEAVVNAHKSTAKSYLIVWDDSSDVPRFNLEAYKKGGHDKELQMRFIGFKDRYYFPREAPENAKSILTTHPVFTLKPMQYALLELSLSHHEASKAMEKGQLGQYVSSMVIGEAAIQAAIYQLYQPRGAKP